MTNPTGEGIWPSHVPRSLTPARTPIWDSLAVSARRYPERPALIFMEQALSYEALWQAVLRLAAQLRDLGVNPGDRVILDMQNCPQLVIAHFAILRANAVVVPVNPMNRCDELRHFILDAGARLAITTDDVAGEMVAASDGLPVAQRLQHLIVTSYTDAFDPGAVPGSAFPDAWRTWLQQRHSVRAPEGGHLHRWEDCFDSAGQAPGQVASPDDLALLPYTSGTTGQPKGCMLSHAAVMHNAAAVNIWNSVTSESISLAVVPMFHITGIVGVLHSAILAAATLVLMPRWDRVVAAHLIAKHKVTHWANIPTMVIDLLNSPNADQLDLSSLLYIGGGGAAMPQAIAQRLYSLCGLRYVEAYGLTETSAPSHCNPAHAPKQQCLGVPFVSVEARLIDPLTLQEVAPGQEGEIVIRGPQLFSGYWKQPEATHAAFVELQGVRFFRSGDIGRIDAEGYYHLTDRLKRMINASGFKVWPAEIEALMYGHPGVQEVCVIATRDAYRGESAKALVVRKPSHATLSETELEGWCRASMAAYKVPRAIRFVDSLPKSGSGKVMWRALQEAEARGA